MDLLPQVNDPVVLRDAEDRDYLSRVEDVRVGLLVVARPHDLPADGSVGPGREVDVVWSDGSGVSTALPTRILAAHAEGRVELLSLAVTGPGVRLQRRQFVRAPASGTVVLRVAPDDVDATDDADEAEPVTGSLLDVSEAALRCTVPAGSADGFLARGERVVAEFRYGDADFTVTGRAEFLRPTENPAAFEQLVVVFDEPVAAGDALRKEIFAQEVRGLRARGTDDR